jgi:hypothetical protein
MENKDIYDWIKKIIETCNNNFHFEAVDKLIDLYYERFEDEQKKTELLILRTDKWNEIHLTLI